MGSLRTLTILLALGAWGAATEGAPLDDGTPSTNGTNRAPLPAPAAEYLKGGIRLYNTGDQTKAAKYLKVANEYRDQLQADEVTQLDNYLAKFASAPTDPAVQPAATGAGSAPMGAAPMESSPPIGSARGTSDPKQEARWKLQAAREQMRAGNYDEATRIVLEVQKMNIRWGLFDETPTKVAEAIAKARPKATASAGSAVKDKKTAIAKLKEAHEMLKNNQYDQAESLALEVKSWGLRFGMFEENPDKVASAARVLRKRDEARQTPYKEQDKPEQYDVLVSEARHYVATGEYDKAEARASQALRMNVAPPVSADRAESVLNDIAIAKASRKTAAVASNTPAPTPAPAPAAETPSLAAERDANALLAQGKNQEAAAKFVQAQQLRDREMTQPTALASAPVPASAPAMVAPVVDQAVQQVASNPAPVVGLQTPVQGEPVPPVVGSIPAPVVAGPAAGPSPIPDPSSPPIAMPVPEAAPLSTAPPVLSSEAAPAGNKGEELLANAKTFFVGGNYAAAREMATQAKAGNYGVNSQADEMLAQIGLSEQGGALAVYESALDAMRKGDADRARALLTEVAASGAALDPGMLDKVQNLLMKLPKEGAPKGTALVSDSPVNDAETLKAQQMNVEVGTKVAEARRMMEVDPDKAIELLQTTLTAVKAAELPATVSRTMTRRLEVAIELSKADKVKFDEKMKDKNAKAEIEIKKLRILEASKVKETAIKELMTKSEEAYAKGDFAKAEELARRANEIDPNVIGPQMMAFKANMQRHYELDKDTKRLKEEGFLNEMQAVDKTMIIDADLMNNGIAYPKSFKEMSERRKKMQLSDSRQKSLQELATEKKLNEPITLNLKDQTLDEAIAFISNYTGLNVIVDPKALNDEGLSRESKVNLTANSIKLKSALKYMLNPLGLTYKAEDDVLLITSPQASRDKTYAWTYPVADLVVPPNAQNSASAAVSGFPSINGVVPASPTAMPGQTTTQNGSPSWNPVQRTVTMADMMPLVQLITTTIAPNTWQVAYPDSEQNSYGMGGAFGAAGGDAPAQPGSITPFLLSISLIIRHTAEVHEEVAELLKQLRRLQDLQVSIEVRFITVSDDFFEQIGVDFDFAIQSKTVGKGTSFAAPSGSLQSLSYPFNLVNSSGIGGGGIGGGGIGGGTTTGGVGGGGATTGGGIGGGTTGGAGGTTGGAGGIGGGAGGIGGGGGGAAGGGGVSGGGFAGGGGGIGGAGNFGGGGTGTAGGTAGGTTGGGISGSVGYVVNPFLDNSLGRRTPIVVGTSSGGIGNYTNNLAIPFTQGSAANIQPFNSIPSAGATFGISFLSDLEMYLFLTAAQGDARNNIVQAPKITTFNGANASITNAEVQYYIAQLTPIVGFSSVSFAPTPAPLNDGVTLNVTPVVSADRRYVRLSLAPFFQTVNGLQSFPVPAAVGGGGLGGTGTSISGQIQLPNTTTTNINTTVTVPDGGTVLLGGVKRMREQRLEYGVPVLAKTPLINRLFRNIGIGRRTDSLMLMVTPRIIILEEEEARLGVQTINSAP